MVGGTEWMATLMDYVVDQLFELNRLGAGDPETDFDVTRDKSNTAHLINIVPFTL